MIVIPAKAGIHRTYARMLSMGPGFRRDDAGYFRSCDRSRTAPRSAEVVSAA
ncbi:hypothetical protein FHW83_001071 [Duganella sp. SG902]|nr:hypothetical protein [Duganella sp. SG902]